MNYSVKLCAIAKDEAAYIPEWIFHHLYFGFSKIEIHLNGTTDNGRCLIDVFRHVESVDIMDSQVDLEYCIGEDLPFQSYIYNKSIELERGRSEGAATHVMFLDLDEFWIPRNFETGIVNAIYENGEKSSLSFLWYWNVPSREKSPFSNAFNSENLVQANRHVKSLVNVRADILRYVVHNALLRNEDYWLENGQRFQLGEPADEHFLIRRDVFESRYLNSIPPYFIYHCLYRSEMEYVSSLSRGRAHAKDNRPIKVNRFGFVPYPNVPTLNFSIGKEKLKRYCKRYEEFLEQIELKGVVEESRLFVSNRFSEVSNLVGSNPEVLETYAAMFSGTSLAYAGKKNALKVCVDNAHVNKERQCMVITGWGYNVDTSEFDLNLSLKLEGKTYPVDKTFVKRINRKDVQIAYAKAPLSAGFEMTFFSSDQDLLHSIKEKGSLVFSDALLSKEVRLS